MKSLLVDAIRQANADAGGQTLSDSGSFETVRGDFVETANDEIVLQEESRSIVSDSEELELLDVSGPVTVSEPTLPEDIEVAVDDSPRRTPGSRRYAPGIAADRLRRPLHAPRLARYSPLLCLLLAVVVAAACTLYRDLNDRYALGVTASQLSSFNESQASAAAVKAGDVVRFPFIELPNADVIEQDAGTAATP